MTAPLARPLHALVGVVLSGALLTGCRDTPASLDSSFRDGTIAFLGTRRGQHDIWVMNADGSAQRNLTQDGNDDDNEPAFSPDGSRIAYSHYDLNVYDIWIINADGTGRRNLTNDAPWNFEPAWSPDGTRLAFRGMGGGGLEVMNLDGRGRTQLGTGVAPSWAPDGLRLAVGSITGPTFPPGIDVVNVDGTGRVRVSPDSAFDGEPAWSPDGAELAFINRTLLTSNYNYRFAFRIGIMNADGSDRRWVVGDSTSQYRTPAWSPDGRALAFMSTRDGTEQLYVVGVDGRGLRQLTRNAAGALGDYRNSHPSWKAGRQ